MQKVLQSHNTLSQLSQDWLDLEGQKDAALTIPYDAGRNREQRFVQIANTRAKKRMGVIRPRIN